MELEKLEKTFFQVFQVPTIVGFEFGLRTPDSELVVMRRRLSETGQEASAEPTAVGLVGGGKDGGQGHYRVTKSSRNVVTGIGGSIVRLLQTGRPEESESSKSSKIIDFQ